MVGRLRNTGTIHMYKKNHKNKKHLWKMTLPPDESLSKDEIVF